MAATNFICSSNDVIRFKLVRNKEDLLEGGSFRPAFTHQVFGDEESIFGYEGLDVNLVYSASKLNLYISIKYDRVIESEDGQKPEDIYKKLISVIRHPVCSNVDLFLESLEKEDDFTPYGSLVKPFTLDQQGKTRHFEVYVCDPTTAGFIPYLERMETFLIWFIDAASYIDSSDPRWQFFLLYEKILSLNGKRQYSYNIIGYISVYSYFAYPENIRPRISQVLILPPYQNVGLCAHLLDAFYHHYSGIPKIRDITVEAPNPAFQSVRDYVDCSKCSKLGSFSKDKLIKGYSKNMVEEARSKFKLTAKQIHRVYEIIYLKEVVGSDEEKYSLFMEQIKKRLILRSHILDGDYSEELWQIRKKRNHSINTPIELSEEAEAEIYDHVKETMFQYKNVIRRLVKFPFDF